jgi:hypothetical protein
MGECLGATFVKKTTALPEIAWVPPQAWGTRFRDAAGVRREDRAIAG